MECPSIVDRLPNELLMHVFHQLYRMDKLQVHKNLLACVLVSRRWHNVALPFLWRSLCLPVDCRTGSHEPLIYGDLADITNEANAPLFQVSGQQVGSNGPGKTGIQRNVTFRLYQSLQLQLRRASLDGGTSFSFCRHIFIRVIDGRSSRADLKYIASILTACKNLQHVDFSLDYTSISWMAGAQSILNTLAKHPSASKLKTLRVKLGQEKRERVVTLFCTGDRLLLSGIHIFITHLSIKQLGGEHANLNFKFLGSFINLRSFTFGLNRKNSRSALRRFTEPETVIFWNSLKGLPLESLVLYCSFPPFSWDDCVAILPPNLTTLVITLEPVYQSRKFNPIVILQQLVKLKALTINLSEASRRPSLPPTESEVNLSLQQFRHQSIICRNLRMLHIHSARPDEFFETVVIHCPLLEDLAVSECTDDNLLTIATGFKMLSRVAVTLNKRPWITLNGLLHLSLAKELSRIYLSGLNMSWLNGRVLLETWARTLPLLQWVILRDSWTRPSDTSVRQMEWEETCKRENWLCQYHQIGYEEIDDRGINIAAMRRDLLKGHDNM
jgi:hypothetical protein